ncbi:MAG: hypothetical protein JO327_13020 [Nitrososphaeraceae archaeon]|nr:hypothetical protein [Nitrososphaeraceae archaeon]MBV9669037.1 hypothetical protein [Nitrososphaeraceae archaeon]
MTNRKFFIHNFLWSYFILHKRISRQNYSSSLSSLATAAIAAAITVEAQDNI